MKELMNEIERRFFRELEDPRNINANADEVKRIYTKVSKEVYLESLSKVMDRQS